METGAISARVLFFKCYNSAISCVRLISMTDTFHVARWFSFSRIFGAVAFSEDLERTRTGE